MKKFVLLVIAIALVVAGSASARSQATKVEIGATMAASEEVPAPKGDTVWAWQSPSGPSNTKAGASKRRVKSAKAVYSVSCCQRVRPAALTLLHISLCYRSIG